MGTGLTAPLENPAAPRRRLVIVGGGITGLAAAHRVFESPTGSGWEVVLLEGSARLGGVIATERRDGFLLEGGPDSFITEKPEGIALCRRLGLEGQLLPTNESFRRTLIVHGGVLRPLPDGFQLLGPTRLLPFLRSPVLSLRGKLAAAKDLVLPRGGPPPGGDESLAHFVRRRFGDEVLQRLAQPLAGGIYTADPETLSLAATMPRFLELERRHRSVFLGLRAQARRAGAAAAGTSGARFGMFVTLRDGMASLIAALAATLPAGTVRLGARVQRLSRHGEPGATSSGWRVDLEGGEPVAADAVLVAVPAPAAADILAGVDQDLARELAGIEYASSAVITLAYRREQLPHAPQAFGFVVPAVERRLVIAGSFSSVKYAGRAPSDTVLLRLFIGGALQPELFRLGDDELVHAALAEARALLGVGGEPILTWLQRWPESMPQYHVGHAARVAAIEERVHRLPGLALAGNAYHGVGLADCVRSGEAAADDLLTIPAERGGARA